MASYSAARTELFHPTKAGAISKDKDKLIRQLSLVAYLMQAGSRKADSMAIHENVEGYADMTGGAFARRFYADRDELARLGIRIEQDTADLQAGGMPENTLYWLPPENYFLPAIEFTTAELAAINTCLGLLDGQFAYSDLLRLALQSLVLGSGNSLEDPVTDYICVNLLSSGEDAAAADRLAKIEAAVARHKTIIFDYHALGRDSVEERRVDPYLLMFTRRDWYLVGRSQERDDIRIFRLRRIRGKIRHATGKERDFTVPETFDRRDYASLEPWQLGPEQGRARIRISPRAGWLAVRSLGHCGTARLDDEGGGIFETAYSEEGPLLSLVLGMGSDAELEEPAALRQRLADCLETIEHAHRGDPPPLPEEEKSRPRQPPAAEPQVTHQVKPERFTKLTTLISYLTARLGEEESLKLPAASVCADLGYENPGQLNKDLDLLLLVSVEAGGYVIEAYLEGETLRVERSTYGDLMRRPARLSPLGAKAILLAIDLVGGHILAGASRSLKSARDKILAAGGLEEGAAVLVGETEREDAGISRAVALGLEERRLVEIEYLSLEGEASATRRIEPLLVSNSGGDWYLVAFCRLAGAERVFRFENIKSAAVLDEHFEPRDIDLEPYRANPCGGEPPRRALLHFSPGVARLVGEGRPSARLLEDGSLVDEILYFSPKWLAREVLKYRGEALVIQPGDARESVAAAAAGLAARYR